MRAIGAVAVASFVALDVSAVTAQSTRHFHDSWFWGAKVGVMVYQVQSEQDTSNATGWGLAPSAGIDWVITRKRGGLYVSYDHSFFKGSVLVNDSISPLDTVPRQVNLTNMRKVSLIGLFFPLESQRFHPYAGLGATLNSIAKAEPVGTFRNNTQQNLVLATVNQFKTVASPVFMVGAQLRLIAFSVFGQATATPTYNNFFLFTDNNWRTTGEVGIRYNIGSSIDRMR
jgi:hypothetical protein